MKFPTSKAESMTAQLSTTASGLLETLERATILPVLTVGELDSTLELVNSLQRAGYTAIEITLRSETALRAIERVRSSCPLMTVGVGTVVRPDQLDSAARAGAQFAVSPGCSPALLEAESRLPMIPGVATPSEAMVAAAAGFQVLKLFPAAVVGGTSWLRAIFGPLPDLRFCPTGGINGATFKDYLALPNVVCVGGSWMVDKPLAAAGDWAALSTAAKNFLQ